MTQQLLFFVGKGGVGKSTTSAVTAVHLANTGHDTLLVSMDPAHNQGDIFQTGFSEKARSVSDKLAVREVDTDYWIGKYLKDTETRIRKNYAYHSAFNLQGCFDVLKYSPGLEEYALLLAFRDVLSTSQEKEVILFDMAPTALTLRFFSLPFTTLMWTEELMKLRNRINEKKEIISKIRLGHKTLERDRVKSSLGGLISDYQALRDLFLSGRVRVNLVINTDRLSFSEAVRIQQKLDDLKIGLDRIVVNKVTDGSLPDGVRQTFAAHRKRLFPLWDASILGLDAINQYIRAHAEIFEER
ncbi:ArsA family ATPase [Desulfonema ishimotonii]|nr:ArsA family ATPase [Desulfonema ishimotonii]